MATQSPAISDEYLGTLILEQGDEVLHTNKRCIIKCNDKLSACNAKRAVQREYPQVHATVKPGRKSRSYYVQFTY